MTFAKKEYLKVVMCIVALISTFTTDTYAQELPIEHFTPLDEVNPLPEAAVLSTYQDSLGYLWVANYGFGLLRYDGQTMEEYTGEGASLGQQVFALQEGPYGRLWALSNDKGLAVSEKPLSAYTAGAPVQFADSLGGTALYRGRPSIFRGSFTQDAEGGIWLGTAREGIIRYRFEGPSRLVVDTLATILRSDSTYATTDALVTRHDGSVWASLTNEALLVFDDGMRPARRQDIPCPELMQLYEDSRSTLWAGCNRAAVWQLDDETNIWEEVKPAETGLSYITRITEVEPGLLWVTGLEGGIWELDTATGATAQYTRRHGLLDRNVWDVTTDREGNIWVSQNTGLSKLRMNQAAIRTYSSRSYTGEQPALVGAEAMAAEPDITWPLPSNDTLQVVAAATTGGVSLIGADGTVEHLTTDRGLTSDLVLDVCHDAAGRVWIMTREGIDIVSTTNPAPPLPAFAEAQPLTLFGGAATLTSYPIGMTTGCGTPSRGIARAETSTGAGGPGQDTGEDVMGEDPTVCFLRTQRPSVGCWVGNRWLFFDVGSGIPDQPFRTLAWDIHGHLYAGATYGGLYRSTVPLTRATPDTLVGDADSLVPYVEQPVFSRILDTPGEPFAGEGVAKIVRAGDKIWARPEGAATHILEGASPRVAGLVDIGDVDGQPNTMAYAPITNTVWLSTGEGIIEADATGQPTGRRAGQPDGLLFHTASGEPSLRVGTDGTIYHSSTAGITRYQPARDRLNTTPPRLDFRRIHYTEDNAGSNELEITYAALSYTSERQVRYRTRLLGYDDEWSEPTTETRARYTNLAAFALPRTYTFEVQATNNDGVWTEVPLAHEVRVQPAWWIKWWALTLYSGVFLALVFVSDRLQRKRLIEQEREKARERELEQARETERAYAQLAESHQELKRTQDQLIQQEKLASLGQLTAGIAHEIKNPLNFVNNFSDVSLELVEEVRQEIRDLRREIRESPFEGGSEQSELGDDTNSARDQSTNLILEILDDIESNLKTIHKHGTRADSIVKSMLQHSRGGDGVMEPTPLNPLIKEYVNLAFHGMRAGSDPINVDIDLQLDESVGEVLLIAEDFSRVILNITIMRLMLCKTQGTRVCKM